MLEKLESCPGSFDEIREYFGETAELLMNNFVISARGVEYEIVEIEFYLFTPDHPDVITYPRQCAAGQWFFHQSGVDLTFATTDKQFGGILIRGLRETKGERKQVFGPQNCVDLLWNKFNAFEVDAAEIPIITPSNVCVKAFPTKCQRWIPAKGDKTKFSARIAEWTRRIEREGFNEFNSKVDISALVVESKYRLIKTIAIDITDKSWMTDNAKIN